MATVPVFAPDGTLGDIPQSQLVAAVKAGAKPGVNITAPDGSHGVIPADRTQEAAKAGAKIIPFDEQPVKGALVHHFGDEWLSDNFKANPIVRGLNSLGETILNTPKAIGKLASAPTPEEIQQAKSEGENVEGALARPVLAARRIIQPVKNAVADYSAGKVSPEAAASVLPEALGQGAGAAIAPELARGAVSGVARGAGVITDTASTLADHPVARATVEAGKAVASELPAAAVRRIPYVGDVLSDVYKKASSRYKAAKGAEPPATLDNAADRLAEVIAQDRQRTLEIQSRGLGELPATGARSAAETGEALATKPTTTFPETPTGGKTSAPRFTPADRARAQQLLSNSLQQHTEAVIDNVIPREGGTYGANLHTRAAVDFHLQRGDVAGAEQALDQGAKQANPDWEPLERRSVPREGNASGKVVAPNDPLPTDAMAILDRRFWQFSGSHIPKEFWENMTPEKLRSGLGKLGADEEVIKEANGALYDAGYRKLGDIEITADGAKIPREIEGELGASSTQRPAWQPMERQIVPSTNDIRARAQADAAAPKTGTRADFNEDQQIEDTMRFDLQKHGWAAESEARREFIARNSTGMTKGELAKRFAAGSGKGSPAADSTPEDLTDALTQSLDEVRKRRAQK